MLTWRKTLTALVVVFAAMAVWAATDPNMGTWKLNEAKSKLDAGAPKNDTVVYESAPDDQVKVTVDGTTPDGKPLHSEWTGKFDGKDYPVTGEPNADTRAYKRIDNHTLALTGKKAGKVVTSGTIKVAPDGKTRTVKIRANDRGGKKTSFTAVYDKQ
jgi:hypothetical protein